MVHVVFPPFLVLLLVMQGGGGFGPTATRRRRRVGGGGLVESRKEVGSYLAERRFGRKSQCDFCGANYLKRGES